MDGDLMVVVSVSPGKDGAESTEYLTNYSKTSVKEWLVKTTVWAVSNGVRLSIRAATTADVESRQQFKPRSA